MIDKVELAIDKYIILMCLFGIWADVHAVGTWAKFCYYTSIFYAFAALFTLALIALKVYYDFKLNRMKK